jgi:hypothetical protein
MAPNWENSYLDPKIDGFVKASLQKLAASNGFRQPRKIILALFSALRVG